MGRSYYYFAATLPMISWEGKVPMSVDAFLSECRRLIVSEDFKLIAQLLGDDGLAADAGNVLARAWIVFDRNFRNELAQFRAQRAHKDPAYYVRGDRQNDPNLRDIIHQASKMPNLLEAEKFLDRERWQFLDGLGAGEQFNLECLIVYGLKLKILERQHSFLSPEGRNRFAGIRLMEFPESCLLTSPPAA